MRANRVIINYEDSYEPSDAEIDEWATDLLCGFVCRKVSKDDTERVRAFKREFNKHARQTVEALMSAFNADSDFAEFLAEKFPDDLEDYFREAYELQAAKEDEPSLTELENEEYTAAVAAGLRR